MRAVGILGGLLVLSGCATGPSLQSRMASYIGASEATLVQNLGVPDRQVKVGDAQYFAYQLRNQMQTSGSTTYWSGGYWGGGYPGWGGWGGYPGWGGYYNSAPQSIQVYSCEVTFLLEKQRVYTFMLKGNDCS